jgi:hypothetical protein
LPLYCLASITYTPLGAMAMWSMLPRRSIWRLVGGTTIPVPWLVAKARRTGARLRGSPLIT